MHDKHPRPLYQTSSDWPETYGQMFQEWMTLAAEKEINDPAAMSLATVDPDGYPSVRMVLLRGFDENGFVFYTNFESRKGQALLSNPRAGLCIHWKSLRRQVRAVGDVEQVSAAEADAYFAARPHGSQIGAWASLQSQPLDSRRTFETRIDEFEQKFGEDVPRPPHWSGFRIRPFEVEFWVEAQYRLHERCRYTKNEENTWQRQILYP